MADIERIAREKAGPFIARLGLGLIVVIHAYGRICLGGGALWHPYMHPTVQVLYAWGELIAGAMVILGVNCRIACGVLVVLVLMSAWHDFSYIQLLSSIGRMENSWLFHILLFAVLLIGPGEWSLTVGFARARGRSKQYPPQNTKAA